MPPGRYVHGMEPPERERLERRYRETAQADLRTRCQMILLSVRELQRCSDCPTNLLRPGYRPVLVGSLRSRRAGRTGGSPPLRAASEK